MFLPLYFALLCCFLSALFGASSCTFLVFCSALSPVALVSAVEGSLVLSVSDSQVSDVAVFLSNMLLSALAVSVESVVSVVASSAAQGVAAS